MIRSTRARLLAVAACALVPAAVLAAPAGAAPAAPGLPPAGPTAVPGAWVVTLEPGASARGVSDEHARRHGAAVDHVYSHAVNGYAARMSEQAAARVAQDPRVAVVERDRVVAIDARPGGQDGPAAAAQILPTGIDRIDAEASAAFRSGGRVDVDVAVLDTGIANHADLVVAGGRNCTTGKTSAYGDRHGHGTHVAGTVAAKNDGSGVVGVAPGARLWAVKVLNDQGSGTLSSVVCGIDWVTANAATIEVANMSLGGSGADGACAADAYHAAICRSVGKGVTYVVAAGNDAKDAGGFVPATYEEVITVSALADFDGSPGGLAAPTCRVDVDDTLADFSNHGADVDLIAPGVCIRSTWPGGGYNTISGTSMASPHVAGAAALHKAGNRAATPAQVKTALQAAGTTDWSNADDPDGVKEKLLRVATF